MTVEEFVYLFDRQYRLKREVAETVYKDAADPKERLHHSVEMSFPEALVEFGEKVAELQRLYCAETYAKSFGAGYDKEIYKKIYEGNCPEAEKVDFQRIYRDYLESLAEEW
jgi:hypothetical protein